MRGLSRKEVAWSKKENVSPEMVLKIKNDFLKLIPFLKTYVYVENEEIIYDPSYYHESEKYGHSDFRGMGTTYFSFPNHGKNRDCFPTPESKVGFLAYHKFGLQVEWWDNYIKGNEDLKSINGLLFNQRASLRAFQVFPREFYEMNYYEEKNSLMYDLPWLGGMGEFEIPFSVLSTLGRCGLKRSDDVVEFYVTMMEETKLPIDCVFSENVFLGLAKKQSERRYLGLNKEGELKKVRNYLLSFFSGESGYEEMRKRLNRIKLKTSDDAYDPTSSVSLRGVRVTKKTMERVENGLRFFEKIYRERKSDPWKCYEDILTAIDGIRKRYADSI